MQEAGKKRKKKEKERKKRKKEFRASSCLSSFGDSVQAGEERREKGKKEEGITGVGIWRTG